MPVISLTMGEGQTTIKQKKELIETFTASAAEITGLPVQAFTILIQELAPTSIGVGGKTLTDLLASRNG